MSEVDDTVNFILDIVGCKNLGETQEEHGRNLAFIYKFIMDKFHMLTLEEIKEAFRMYVAKQFEAKVFRMLDCVLVAEVLHSYIEHRNNILLTYKPKDTTPKIDIITASGKEEINKSAVNRVFSEFKELKQLPDGVTYVYDTLVEHGLIKLASENTPKLKAYYDEKLKLAKEELLRETKKQIEIKKSTLDVMGLNYFKETLQNLESSNVNSIAVRAKKLVLTDFFNNKVLSGAETIFNL